LAEWHEGEGLPHGWLCPGAFSTDRAGRRVLTPPGPQGWATAYTAPDDAEPIQRVIVITQPDGGTSRLSASAIPLRDPDGRLLGVTLLVAEAD